MADPTTNDSHAMSTFVTSGHLPADDPNVAHNKGTYMKCSQSDIFMIFGKEDSTSMATQIIRVDLRQRAVEGYRSLGVMVSLVIPT